ncbi:hypothetical protein GW796_05580 [archaeon]|nr:hypothetical protein [archaeon]NCQ51355.1 hypothetical protein [archaeon]NCT58819.1 hypothetical protein [archaeon]
MNKIYDYWKMLSKDSNKSLDKVETAWRQTVDELSKEGIKPTDKKYNSELILRTKKKVMKESKLQQYLNELL